MKKRTGQPSLLCLVYLLIGLVLCADPLLLSGRRQSMEDKLRSLSHNKPHFQIDTSLAAADITPVDRSALARIPSNTLSSTLPTTLQSESEINTPTESMHGQEILLTTDPSSPSLMQIPSCNNIARRLLHSTLVRCNVSLIILSFPAWIQSYTQNVCANPTCFNVLPADVLAINRECPKGYVGRVKVEEGGRVFYVRARVADWAGRIDEGIVARIPACTKDITGEYCLPKIANELASLSKPKKSIVCSRCARLMAHSMLKSSSLPLFSGLTLSNRNTYKVDDVTIWESMGDVCGEDFMLEQTQSLGEYEVWPCVYLMMSIGACFYYYRYGFSLKLNL